MMNTIKAIVLRAAGINCDLETEYALELAGASAERVHINKIIENPSCLKNYQFMVIPGGFSYGDDVAAGKILANQIIHHLSDAMRNFINDGKIILGICNGFQVLVKTGLLPGIDGLSLGYDNPVTITNNDCGKFEDRWVYLEPDSTRCVFLEEGRRIYLPIAHGEGKISVCNGDILDRIKTSAHVAFRYVDQEGNFGSFPVNPNGSIDSIAGLTDSTGRILGLMPHPERFVHQTHHPRWTRIGEISEPDGMTLFNNGVKYLRENL